MNKNQNNDKINENSPIVEGRIVEGRNITGEQRKTTTEQLLKNIRSEEHYEHSKLSKHEKQQIIHVLENMDLNKERHSKGSEGVIFKIEIIDEEGKPKEFIAAKKRYDNDPSNERTIHQKVENIIEREMQDSIVKVPKLKAVISLDSMEKFIIMEFVHGKTLYQMELEEIFKKWKIPIGEFKSDIEAENTFFKLLNMNPMNKSDSEKVQKRYYQEIKTIKLFSPEQGELYKKEIKRFLKTIHEEGIYHRDGSNPRNIIITPEGKIYIIDFGKSVYIKDKNINENKIYEKQEGEHMIGIFPRDEEILREIAGLTKSKEDIEWENEVEDFKRKTEKIQSDKSVLEYLKEIPTFLLRNKNKAENIKKRIEAKSKESKKIGLIEMEEAKTNEDMVILILAQSKKNIENVIEHIALRRKALEREISNEKIKQNNIPSYVYTLMNKDKNAEEKYKERFKKNIEKIEKKIDKINKIEEYLNSILKIIG